MTKKINLPAVDISSEKEKIALPFNGNAVTAKSFSFSFACFDRTHQLFNLGDNTNDGVVSGKWFLDFLDCLKSVSNKTLPEIKASLHDLHPVDWGKANTSPPNGYEQYEYWQFRINKSKGRVIGFITQGVFYVVWLDPHHNLTDSVGYPGIVKHYAGLSLYETQEAKILELQEEIKKLKSELEIAAELIGK